MTFKIRAMGQTHVGLKRKNNQDALLLNVGLGLFAVADGMGGHKGGEIASLLSIQTLEKELKDKSGLGDPLAHLENAIHESNRVVFQHGRDQGLPGMGTTLTVAWVQGDFLYVGHVGDSRLLMFKQSQSYQLTEDHSQIYELMKAGLINEKNAHLVQKNIITRSVGFDAEVRVDSQLYHLKSGDLFLICSDGLSGLVVPSEMSQVIQNQDFLKVPDKLIELANLRGGDDNITVVVAEVE